MILRNWPKNNNIIIIFFFFFLFMYFFFFFYYYYYYYYLYLFIYFLFFFGGGMNFTVQEFYHRFMCMYGSTRHLSLSLIVPFKVILRKFAVVFLYL